MEGCKYYGAFAAVAFVCFLVGEMRFEQSQLQLIRKAVAGRVSYQRTVQDEPTTLSTFQQEPPQLLLQEQETTTPANMKQRSIGRRFYLLPLPELTSWLAGNYTEQAKEYYRKALNEEQAEVWLHRILMEHPDRTEDPEAADIIIVCAYLHFNKYMLKYQGATSEETQQVLPILDQNQWGELVKERIIPGRIHTLAIPTWNPSVSKDIGVKHLSEVLQSFPVPTKALGFERNEVWSRVPTDEIVPIPYVASPSVGREELGTLFDTERRKNFVFYAGDHRKHADAWAGCNRSQLVAKLHDAENMDVKLRSASQRITQEQYNTRMLTSDFCLILCGDTPTSRSLASAILHGCVPLIIGSRLRGMCDPPCHEGWGWSVAEKSHVPFNNLVDWNFPELDEARFAEDPMPELIQVFANETQKQSVRNRMKQWHLAWVYGWGDPITSTDFGLAADYGWRSLAKEVFGETS